MTEIDRILKSVIVEIDTVDGIVGDQELVGKIVGFAFLVRFAFAIHADMAVSVDKCGRHDTFVIGIFLFGRDPDDLIAFHDDSFILQDDITVVEEGCIDDGLFWHIDSFLILSADSQSSLYELRPAGTDFRRLNMIICVNRLNLWMSLY